MAHRDRAPMATIVKHRLTRAASVLGAMDPVPLVGPLLDRSFPRPVGQLDYGANTLAPGTLAVEPSFAEDDASLRVVIEPLTGASPSLRTQEATREMRRMVMGAYGGDALRWFDRWSETWRGAAVHPRASYGAWFGVAVDGDGLAASKIYYELTPEDLDALPDTLREYVIAALQSAPGLVPLFTSIRCGRMSGTQRVTLLSRGPLRLGDLSPLLARLGLSHQLPGLMQVVGLALGGRFELPEMSVMIGLRDTGDGPELKLEVVLGMIPDRPRSFLDLLGLALAERPREKRALERWLAAFTPETADWPGEFSVMSVRVTRSSGARVSLYLRPVEFELTGDGAPAPSPAMGVWS